jgi:putative aldouronate transport system substrate-binding protein
MGSVANSRGQMFSRAANTGNQGYVAISTSTVKTLQDLHYYLDFMDKCADEIGQNLLNNGAEGVNYTRNPNGTITTIPAAQIPNGWNVVEGWNQFRTLSDKNYTGVLNPRQVRQEEVYLENARIVVVDPTVPFQTSSPTWAARSTSLNQIQNDAIINYIIGNIDRAGFDREKARWYSEGGTAAIAELQAAYDAAR